MNLKTGYKSPGNMRDNIANFFWKDIDVYIKDAVEYLKMTVIGMQWVDNLYYHIEEFTEK
jgi:hypothetical protein